MKRLAAAGAVIIVLLLDPCPVVSCGFINEFATAKTFRLDVAESKLVVYGTLTNPRKGPGDGTMDFLVESVIKSHPMIEGKKKLTLARYVAVADPRRPPRFLIFCDVFKGQIVPYRGDEVSSTVSDYLKGLLAIDATNYQRRLRYCFDFLDHVDKEIAKDAFYEFMKTPDRELGSAARKLPATKLRLWLSDPKTEAVRLRLYGFLLGNGGAPEDAILLRSLAARLSKQKSPAQIDGILTGWTLLQRKEGWAHISSLLANPSCDFQTRLSGLRAARYFHNTRSDVIPKRAIVEAMKPALNQDDLADLVIEDLRRWRCWDLTSTIPRKSHHHGQDRKDELTSGGNS